MKQRKRDRKDESVNCSRNRNTLHLCSAGAVVAHTAVAATEFHAAMGEHVKAVATILILPLIACVACDTYSLRSDQKAKDAVLILQKLNARLETGISYRDYSAALGEANFPVKQFLESGHAEANADFSMSLRNAMKW